MQSSNALFVILFLETVWRSNNYQDDRVYLPSFYGQSSLHHHHHQESSLLLCHHVITRKQT